MASAGGVEGDPIVPDEVFAPGEEPRGARPADDAPAADRLAWLLDNAIRIPGVGLRFGFDGLIGLIPGVGDGASTVLSAVIIVAAIQRGVPIRTALRMVGNVLVDTAVGTIPFLGDAFDFVWKANAMNARLLADAIDDGVEPRSAARSVGIAAVAVGVLVVAGAIAMVLSLMLLTLVVRAIF